MIKNRIPEIDILLKDQQVWRKDNFEAKIFIFLVTQQDIFVITFFNEKILFTGDTLFSLGCGKIFEGTYAQMFNSLRLFKNFPLDTKIYCGHEYTLQNSKFCIEHDPKNKMLINKILKIKEKVSQGYPTLPSTIEDEINCNIFLKANDVESFSKLRDLKDNF
jgi:hydroxyacylglutathione hydrolase